MKPRLKSHKFGTQYPLRPLDVVIASYFPISRHVHQVRAIITREQVAERGEWITSKPFVHSTMPVSAKQVAELESHLARLAELKPWANTEGYAPDYEEAVRRLLRYRVNSVEVRAFLPRRSMWGALGVRQDGIEAFNAAWNAVWDCVGTTKDIEMSTPAPAQD
jgi:hypothetical protein